MKMLQHADKVSIKIKLLVFALVAFLAILVPAYYLISSASEDVSHAENNLAGVPLAQKTVVLRKLIAQHRGTSARFLGGDESARPTLNSIGNEVSNLFDELVADLENSNNANAALTSLKNFQTQWQEIRYAAMNKTQPGAQVFARHSQLIVNVGEVNTGILRAFKLFYAPTDSAYHLVIANFNALPSLTDSLGKIRGNGAGVLARGELSDSNRATLQGLILNATSAKIELLQNLRSASANTQLTEVRELSKDANTFEEAIADVIDLLETHILTSSELNYPSAQFFDQVTQQIGALYTRQDAYVGYLSAILEASKEASISKRNSAWLMLIILAVLTAVVFFAVNFSITDGIRQTVGALNRLAKNNYDIKFSHGRDDEIGSIQSNILELGSSLSTFSRQSVEAMRVKQALDNSSTCFMMADKDRTIIYMNDAVKELLQKAEADIRKDLPSFDASDLMGKSIDNFHKNPVHQQRLLDRLETTHVANLTLGEYSFRLILNPIFGENKSVIGHSVEWHDMTEFYEKERVTARILESLNCTTTNVMIADADRNIIYLNRSVQTMLKEVERDLQKALPHFKADDLLGKNMDIFHKNPAHQQALLDKLTNKYETQIEVAGRYFRLIANPILSESGERLGSVVEWLDRTVEVRAEMEIAEIVEAAVEGNFTSRAEEEGKHGFYLNLSKGLNELLDITEQGLNEISRVLLAISKGDLTQRITADFQGTFNQMKEYCNTSADNLTDVISEIREASQTITSGSSEIAKGNADLSSRTEQQASNLEETASSMEEITSTVQLNADNAKQANGLASDAASVASDGGKLIEQVVGTMSGINESATKIADIIGVIDGIAFQTNILALNAAVEAARAGEQGRGFAVVASEVRTLAQRSANAAKDIKELISDSVSKIESGNALVNQSGETMNNIVDSIKRVNDIMSEIASASAEQASGIDEINRAIVQMDEMTQQNAALVEEAAAAAESMNNQAEQLVERVQTFQLDDSFESAPKQRALPSYSKESKASSKPSAPPKELPSPKSDDDDEWESF